MLTISLNCTCHHVKTLARSSVLQTPRVHWPCPSRRWGLDFFLPLGSPLVAVWYQVCVEPYTIQGTGRETKMLASYLLICLHKLHSWQTQEGSSWQLVPRFCVAPMGAAGVGAASSSNKLPLPWWAGQDILYTVGEERTWQHIWSFSCVLFKFIFEILCDIYPF